MDGIANDDGVRRRVSEMIWDISSLPAVMRLDDVEAQARAADDPATRSDDQKLADTSGRSAGGSSGSVSPQPAAADTDGQTINGPQGDGVSQVSDASRDDASLAVPTPHYDMARISPDGDLVGTVSGSGQPAAGDVYKLPADTRVVMDDTERPLAGQVALASTSAPVASATPSPPVAPVILDLDGKGVQTVPRAAGGVRYDLDGDGLADLTSWIGSTEGFLFLDRDGNGTVTNAAEFNFLADLPGAKTGLQGLAAFDSNKDSALSASDTRWGDFRIWQDKNGNGVAEAAEIQTLAAAGVRSINLNGTAYTGTNSPADVAILAKGSYTRTNGVTMDVVDAALTYVSAPRDGLPTIAFATQQTDGKASASRLFARDGRLVVAARHGGDEVDARAGGLTGAVELSFKHSEIGMLAAVVLDLDGDGVALTGSGRSRGGFDMNGDGSLDRQGWAGRGDGFLVIDRDGDGRISNGAELSLLAEDPNAGSSLAALAKLDSNGDKLIDKNDARFGELKVWADANGNGVTDPGELKALTDVGIQSISLDSRATGDKVSLGDNLLMATATFTYANGVKRTLGDAALAFRPSETAGAAPSVNSSSGWSLEEALLSDPSAASIFPAGKVLGAISAHGTASSLAAAALFTDALTAFANPGGTSEFADGISGRDGRETITHFVAPPPFAA